MGRVAFAACALVALSACGRSAPTAATALAGSPAATTGSPTETPGEPTIAGLLVATGGPLLATDAAGALGPMDGAPRDVVTVTASAGVVVAIDGSSNAAVAEGSMSPPAWRPLDLPTDPGGAVRLVSLAPSAKELAVAAGDPQGSSFALVILDLASGLSRSIPVARGLNGAPSWLGAGTVAVDVIEGDGTSAIATIDLATDSVTDHLGPGSLVVSSADGSRLALDDPATGDVLVGDLAGWNAGNVAAMTRIHGPRASGVDGLAMSADGTRLAVVHRGDTSIAIEILVRRGDAWSSVRTLTLPGADAAAVAWLE